jgi:hypothetical protein
MKAQELRIGNLVSFYGTKDFITVINTDDKDFEFINTTSYSNISLEDLKPIPLTEEILLTCGFEKDEDNIFKISKSIYLLDSGFIQIALGYAPIINIKCKYVHQLQNFYYSLYEQELNITL